MYVFAAIGITAFVLCLIVTPVVRQIFLRAQLLDRPDADRRIHKRATPRVGGIAVYLSYVGALGVVFLFVPHAETIFTGRNFVLLSMLPAATLVFLTGLLDDLVSLKPWQKLIGLSIASALAISLGARMSLQQQPEWLAVILSFLWLLVCSNALNLIDGVDGLATGVALFASVTALAVALIHGDRGFALVIVPLVCSLIAFLRYNFHPASIFLGDCGSLTIGFMLGCFGLTWSHSTGASLGMAAPLMALALPLIDVGLAVSRRILRGKPIFRGDRHHIHHKVLDRFTTRRAVLILYVVCGISSSLSVTLSFSNHQFEWLIYVVFGLLACLGIGNLRYVEFSATIRSLSRRSILRGISEEIYIRELEVSLSEAETVEEIWLVLICVCDDLQLTSLKMKIRQREFAKTLATAADGPPWQLTVPLGSDGVISLTRFGEAAPSRLIVAVLSCLQRSIARKDLTALESPAERRKLSYVAASF